MKKEVLKRNIKPNAKEWRKCMEECERLNEVERIKEGRLIATQGPIVNIRHYPNFQLIEDD